MKHRRKKYKFQRGNHDNFITVLHSTPAPTQPSPIRIYRHGEHEIRVFSAGYAQGSLSPSGRVRMPEMEV